MQKRKAITIFFILVSFLLSSTLAFAEDSIGPIPLDSKKQMPAVSNQVYSSGNNTRGLDLGMPEWSSADPEYVAEQKMTESMTTAYNWVALNTARFAEGCKTNRAGLTSEISSVIQQSQETSLVCQRFAAEASACNPELFCSRFSQGNLPLPAEARFAMKRAGYDPDTIKIEDITQEIMIKVCMAANDSEINNRKQMLESAKEQVRQQLSAFRQKCDQMKNQMGTPNIRLPEFTPFQQGPRVVITSPQQSQQMPQGPTGPQDQGQVQQNVCNQTPPDCYPRPPPFCQNGAWVCPDMPPQQQIQQQQQVEQQPQQTQPPAPPTPEQPVPPQIPTPETQPPQLPVPEQPAPQIPVPETPAQEPAPAPAPEPAQTAAQNPLLKIIITGFSIAMNTMNPATGSAVCGNRVCEPDFGENPQNCPQDCMAQGYNSGTSNSTGFNSGSASSGGGSVSGMPQAQGYGTQQGMQPMQGPSPEMLCNMTDEEIVESYTSQMASGMPSQEEMQYSCSMESGRMLQEMNRYKLEIARCRADAALDCQSKKQALQNCNEMKNNPEKISALIVGNMCRRFSTTTAEAAQNKLLDVASKYYDSDPALANQLGDTAEKTVADQQQLDVLSYLFGNGNYGAKLTERAKKLKEVKERLQSKGINDAETISVLESQISELETEGNKFNNPLDITRLGYIFRPKK